MANIVVIGGGTGSYTILSGLKQLSGHQLTAIVPSTDSGGSTGRLRDEFGFLPVGDVRQCLVALTENQDESLFLREILSYRFSKGGDGLAGHNLGNLLLTALTDIYDDEISAISILEKLMNIQGHVFPVSKTKTTLVAEYENGEVVTGEHQIDEPVYPHDGRARVVNLYTTPKVRTYKQVKQSIAAADLIILGPGDLYTSLIANLVVAGVSEAIQRSQARLIYIVNLLTKFGQTYGFTAADHLNEITKYAGRQPDHILINDNHLPKNILKKYETENAFPVVNDMVGDPRVIAADFLAREEVVTPKGDKLKRSLIRHDGNKVAGVIRGLVVPGNM